MGEKGLSLPLVLISTRGKKRIRKRREEDPRESHAVRKICLCLSYEEKGHSPDYLLRSSIYGVGRFYSYYY